MKLPSLYSLLFCLVITGLAQADTLAPERAHQITTMEVVRKLQTRHLAQKSIDDQLSQELLLHYLDRLDSSRQTFLQKDVDALQKKYATALDGALKRGDIQPGFEIFNLYRERSIKQLETTIASMEKIIKSFDYSKDETILVDRSKAAWPGTEAEAEQIARQRLKASALGLKLAGKEQKDIIELLLKRYQNQLDRLQKIRSDDVYQMYMNAFTELYDPHTNYMSPASSDNFDISMSLKLEGIGAMLRSHDEHTQVVRLIHAGPADKQGELKPMDKIVGVAQGKGEMVDVVGWRLDEVVDLI
ncbi:MAG TPA: tail-specific protease, partial [Pseudomonadales bacterium]